MPGQFLPQTWHHNPTVDAPAKYRRACRYDVFLPTRLVELPLSLEGTVAGLVSEAEEAIRALNNAAHPGLAPLARLLLRTESIASSKIEGMQIGVRELARAEAKVEAGGNAGPAALEILANIDAMELALNEAAEADRFTVAEIMAIHHRLMQRALNAERVAGKIRTTQNWIGGNDYNPCGADFIPPPPEEVHGLLDDLCEAINETLLSPLVQAALVHAQFETIHPFADGNGRTGRALIHVVLRRRKLAPAYVPPISVVLATARNRYIEGLTRFRADGVAEWVEQFAVAGRAAARLASAYLRQVQGLHVTWRAKLTARSSPRADAAVWKVIDVLPAHPMITAPVAAAATGRSKPQIYEALAQLEAAGVLVPLSESKRNRSWEVVGLLDQLAGLESGQLPAVDEPRAV
jgi:Fic family protein